MQKGRERERERQQRKTRNGEINNKEREREMVDRERRDKKGMDVSNGVILGGSKEEKRGQVIQCLKKEA